MPRQHHDTPYRDAAPSHAAPPRPAPSRDSASRPPRKPAAGRGIRSESEGRPESRGTSRPDRRGDNHAAKRSEPRAEKRPDARTASNGTRHAAPTVASSAAPARRPSRRRGRGAGGGSNGASQLTSQPTTRNAYVGTRAWLLEQHGPICAYCGRKWTASVMTLDHVTPRRGQTAYDRRDNLVLACPGCNAAKRDLAPLAFLLGDRSRAANLLSYGAHLSPMLLDLARSLVSSDTPAPTESERVRFADWAFDDLDGESPYKD